MMDDVSLAKAALGSFLLSSIPFWMWKSYAFGPRVTRWLVGMYITLYVMAVILSLVFGGRVICQSTQSYAGRGLLFIGLLILEAHAVLMGAMAANFVGK